MKPVCPAFFRRMCLNSIAFISRLAPTEVWVGFSPPGAEANWRDHQKTTTKTFECFRSGSSLQLCTYSNVEVLPAMVWTLITSIWGFMELLSPPATPPCSLESAPADFQDPLMVIMFLFGRVSFIYSWQILVPSQNDNINLLRLGRWWYQLQSLFFIIIFCFSKWHEWRMVCVCV